MEQFTSYIRENGEITHNCLAHLPVKPETICFFDIETTGLSPNISSLYLIGAAVWKKDGFQLTQWFADDYVSEKELLLSFAEFTAPYTAFAHYNGSTFDIPYLEKKYAAYSLSSPFREKVSIDVYRALPGNKSFFNTPDRKLTTMERLLSFHRGDSFTGKECIQLYTEFMHKKFFRDSSSKERKRQLLTHNSEDIQGLILCSQLLSYTHGEMDSSCTEQIPPTGGHMPWVIRGRLSRGFFPVPVSHAGMNICQTYDKDMFCVEISPCQSTLKHYFQDYKNYYYLPKEDTAVHKSVGAYVDREYRRQAMASTCYIKKQGSFFSLPPNFTVEKIPLFYETHRSRRPFIEYGTLPSLTQGNLTKILDEFRGKTDKSHN